MTTLLAVLIPIGLVDAVSITPIAIVPLLAILGGSNRLPNALALILGIIVPYLGLGAVLLLGLSSLFDALSSSFDQWLHDPDALDMILQLAVGVVMLSFGFKLERSRESRDDRGPDADAGAALHHRGVRDADGAQAPGAGGRGGRDAGGFLRILRVPVGVGDRAVVDGAGDAP